MANRRARPSRTDSKISVAPSGLRATTLSAGSGRGSLPSGFMLYRAGLPDRSLWKTMRRPSFDHWAPSSATLFRVS
jgi:hypothetical protein